MLYQFTFLRLAFEPGAKQTSEDFSQSLDIDIEILRYNDNVVQMKKEGLTAKTLKDPFHRTLEGGGSWHLPKRKHLLLS
mgnify:CR=1 FL=1